MKKFILALILLSTSLNSFASNKRINTVQEILSKSINIELFTVKSDTSKPNLLRVELDSSLDETYKNKLHIWLIDSAKTNPSLANIFLTRKPSEPILTKATLLNGSITILFLLTFLFFALRALSRSKVELTSINYEKVLTKKIEEKVETAITKPSRTIDYL